MLTGGALINVLCIHTKRWFQSTCPNGHNRILCPVKSAEVFLNGILADGLFSREQRLHDKKVHTIT